MKLIKPYVEVDRIDPDKIMKDLERRGRVCYKSEGKITADSANNFVAGLINRGHESVIEHEKISVKFVCDRGVTHEIVRHRLGSYSQESTRYCNYGHDGEITVISPFFFKQGITKGIAWFRACQQAEDSYLKLLKEGATPQEARSVLPNSLKTEIEVTYNLREWRHFFRLRCAKTAHPQMQQVAIPLLSYLQERLLLVFGDIRINPGFPEEHLAEVRERNY